MRWEHARTCELDSFETLDPTGAYRGRKVTRSIKFDQKPLIPIARIRPVKPGQPPPRPPLLAMSGRCDVLLYVSAKCRNKSQARKSCTASLFLNEFNNPDELHPPTLCWICPARKRYNSFPEAAPNEPTNRARKGP